jgi:hypothetical protein
MGMFVTGSIMSPRIFISTSIVKPLARLPIPRIRLAATPRLRRC